MLLLGWDAADWDFLQPLLDAGRLPNLAGLIDRGVSGRIASLSPMLSPMLWTSIATGQTGDRHDILGFVEPDPASGQPRPVASTSRRVKALWNLLSQQGRRAVVVNWFASHPAEPIHGAIVSDRFAEAALHTSSLPAACCHPPELAETLAELLVRPADLTPAQVAPFFLERLPADDDPLLHAFTTQLAKCASVHHAATWLAETQAWDFLAVYHDLIDHVGHALMPLAPPRLPKVSAEQHQIYGRTLERVYEYHDLMLGRWLEIAGPDAAVIVLSDHGFCSGTARPRGEDGQLDPNPLAWHRPYGVFVAAGPGLRRDALVHGATLLDVAPTILTLLGLPVPEDFAGTTMTAALDGLAPRSGPSLEAPHPDDGVHRGENASHDDPWATAAALDQLVALGYLPPPGENLREYLQEIARLRLGVLAQVHFAHGRPAEALPLLTQLLGEREDARLRCREALCLLALGRLAEARASAERAAAVEPGLAQLDLLRARLALAEDQPAEAERLLRTVAAHEREAPAVLTQLGVVLLRLGRWSEAEQTFRRALERDPESAEAHDGLGVALRERDALDDAIFHHMRSASLQHARAQTHLNLGIALARRGQIDWALRAFHHAAELAPEHPFPHRCLARLYFSAKRDRARARHHASEMLKRLASLRLGIGNRNIGNRR
ncbi:MAG: alkaline phosphatase family protein [Verrucomicrobia bacterium]|nr:alkaline phosphatase family protein [Verrucomicrobiota bacterium]